MGRTTEVTCVVLKKVFVHRKDLLVLSLADRYLDLLLVHCTTNMGC